MMRRIRQGSYMRGSWAGWPKEPIKERDCPGCGGTGIMAVVQPKEPGRRIFAPRCPKCEGKGRIAVR
jgi:DnaJ-class molecular chaperone